MGFAHSRGILHMDLNPSNVMRDREGRARVMDFDLSRNATTPQGGELVGTLRYISPEHTSTRKLDKRTDVYALGLIIYELITGQPVVTGNDQKKMVEQIRSGFVNWDLLKQHDPAGAIVAVVQMALEHDPAKRFTDANAMHQALQMASRHVSYRGSEGEQPMHGTIEFMLRRIERKGDFPAISRTLMEINRMTAEDSAANAEQLANVILRDYSMTSRLLKLANSAYYGNYAGRVKSVTDAVRLLGVEQVRMACNGLACFGHFSGKGSDLALKDTLIRSFIAGLITRFLASRCGIRDVEEAFICGMLHDLGRTVTMYYFPDDHHDIVELVGQGVAEREATRTVLGVSYAELGYAIAREWSFPEIILYTMADHEMRLTPPTAEHAETLRCLSVFSNALTRLPGGLQVDDNQPLQELLLSVSEFLPIGPEHAAATLSAALEKFTQFASVLDVRVQDSGFLTSAAAWVEAFRQAGVYTADVPAGRILPPVVRMLPKVTTAPITHGGADATDGEWTREFHRLLNAANG
jgi:HD-like signal output (HDOD) protein